MTDFHEHRPASVRGSSDRTFGLFFAALFATIALWPLTDGERPRLALLGLATLLGSAAALRPALLAPANRLWTAFGLLLHRITSPVVAAVLFYGVVTPAGLLTRRLDVLRLRRDPEAATYWLDRDPEPLSPESLQRQF